MAKLIMTKGLPGSGKTTWAKDQIEQNNRSLGTNAHTYVRVNKDDIRLELGKTWSSEHEKEVLRIRDARILDGLRAGFTVISDDTNLAPKHEGRLRSLTKYHSATFEVNDQFLKVHPGECIARDSTRPIAQQVGEKVIMDMYNTYLKPKEELVIRRVEADPNLPSAIICDLDGTLAIHQNRRPFEYDKCDTDLVNTPIRSILTAFLEIGDGEIIFMSGREDSCRVKTEAWLFNQGFKLDPNDDETRSQLYMRKAGDFRKDSIVKTELFDAHVRGRYNVLFCLDDRDQVVKLWRDMGLTCLQVNYGNF